MDDIRFNFLIGQDGAIYEGRGWQVAGQDADGHDVTSLSEWLTIRMKPLQIGPPAASTCRSRLETLLLRE